MVFKPGTLMNLVVWSSPFATLVLRTNFFVSKPLRTKFLHTTRFIHQNITTKIRDATSWHVASSLDVRNTFHIYKNNTFPLLHIGLHRNVFPFSYTGIANKLFFVSFAVAILIPTTNPQLSLRPLGTQPTVAITLQ
jgi:hypothetical protein